MKTRGVFVPISACDVSTAASTGSSSDDMLGGRERNRSHY